MQAKQNVLSPTKPFFAPLVSCTSELDAGLAALYSLLLGNGFSYREAQLIQAQRAAMRLDQSADSATTLATIATNLGLICEKQTLPLDSLLHADRTLLPVMAQLRPVAEQPARWMVIWERTGPFWQVMDPELGQRWITSADLASELEPYMARVSVSEWLCLSASPTFRLLWQKRLEKLQIPSQPLMNLLQDVANDWYAIATFDASLRMIASMVAGGSISAGNDAKNALLSLWEAARQAPPGSCVVIPAHHWTVRPVQAALLFQPESVAEPMLDLRGAVLLQGRGCNTTSGRGQSYGVNLPSSTAPHEKNKQSGAAHVPTLWRFLREDGHLTFAVLAFTTFFAAIGMSLQVLVFSSLSNLGTILTTPSLRLWAVGLIVAFTLSVIGSEWISQVLVANLGLRFDARLRLSVLSFLPQLSNHYFRQLSAGDIIERVYHLRTMGYAPFYGRLIVITLCQFAFTIIGLAWIDWVSALLALVRLALSLLSMRVNYLFRTEYQRTYTYQGFLSHFFLDVMLGLVAVRTHGAERAVRREFEGWLNRWSKINLDVATRQVVLETIDTFVSNALIVLIIVIYAWRGGAPSQLFLLSYWALNLNVLGKQSISLFFLFAGEQIKAERFLGLLNAPIEEELIARLSNSTEREEPIAEGVTISAPQTSGTKATHTQSFIEPQSATLPIPVTSHRLSAVETAPSTGVALTFCDVSVEIAGQVLLHDINLHIPAGSQVAVVGPSGAGKSALMALIFGWHHPSSGQFLIDGEALTYERLQALRHSLAWVDPTIQLWNRSFLDNLRYGGENVPANWIIDQADLQAVLERLPQGMQTSLGGDGRLVSGGEGQRVRFGRSLQRASARLVILDEAFRGLDREKRHLLLQRARTYWPTATLICVTHDVSQTLEFGRVLVVEQGRIVEDGVPSDLAAQSNSCYRALLNAEESVHEKLWMNRQWRHLWLTQGQLLEKAA